MAADTLRQECDERTGKYRENGAGKDCDPLQFMSAYGWKAGFDRALAAARSWLSKRWAELELSPLPRGPKNPKK